MVIKYKQIYVKRVTESEYHYTVLKETSLSSLQFFKIIVYRSNKLFFLISIVNFYFKNLYHCKIYTVSVDFTDSTCVVLSAKYKFCLKKISQYLIA